MQRKITVILCADVVGYARLMAEDEEETLRRLVNYRKVFEDFVGQYNGRIFNTAGDAVLAEFRSSVDAVRAAIDIQETLRTRNYGYPQSRQMLFRIGITIGDVVERDGDLLGDAVNVAARLQGLAAPGGIWVSRTVHEQVAGKMSLHFRDLGAHPVKNIPQPVHVYAVMAGGAELEPAGAAPAKAAAGTRRAWSTAAALATVVAIAAGGVAFWTMDHTAVVTPPSDRPAAPLAAPAATAATSDGAVAGTFIAERVPFLREDNRNDIKDSYVPARDHKALAINRYGYGFAVAEPSEAVARDKALAACTGATNEACEIYAVGDTMVWPHPLPAMPPQPWLREVAGGGEPFDPDRVPFARASDRALIESFSERPLPRALAINDDGLIGMSWGGTGRLDPVRRSLEFCGDRAGVPCLLAAVDDRFAFPFPEGVEIEGLFRPESDMALSPAQRERVMAVYAGPDWRAVAVGAGGIGVTVGRGSQREATESAMAECRRTAPDCRILAINTFRVAARP